MAKKKDKTIRIRQVKSVIGTRREHREVVRSLGLRRIRHVVERPDTPAVRGMVAKVGYLLEVEES
jgi:large subunit ribosomal protein L30